MQTLAENKLFYVEFVFYEYFPFVFCLFLNFMVILNTWENMNSIKSSIIEINVSLISWDSIPYKLCCEV